MGSLQVLAETARPSAVRVSVKAVGRQIAAVSINPPGLVVPATDHLC
jgi:hypothetical protein